MKTYAGSLQRRGRRWYLVVHRNGHQRWFALKTDKLPLARLRAARIAPPDSNDERAWLEKLVREGDCARMRLARLRTAAELTWGNIADSVAVAVGASSSADSRACHVRWLALLADSDSVRLDKVQPCGLTHEIASAAIRELSEKYRSVPRMLGFFRRAWQALGLDPEIWPKRSAVVGTKADGEHYRRLSLAEVRRVHSALAGEAPALADMVLIGYSTGLRLSDVAELELAEIDLPFLNVVPNKTRKRKPHPLRIPLTDEALAAVTRLKLAAENSKVQFLFGAAVRHRPSRRLSAAFRRADVAKRNNGRASFHSLRATFISLMDEAGIPPHVTDAITGHGGGGMHARYTQPSDAARQAAVAQALPSVTIFCAKSESENTH